MQIEMFLKNNRKGVLTLYYRIYLEGEENEWPLEMVLMRIAYLSMLN